MNGPAAIKICGLKDAATVRGLDGMPVTHIGLVFAPSKRRVDAETAAELIAAARMIGARGGLPPKTVGVFVDPSMDELRAVLRHAPLDIVQLHGGETPAFCRAVKEELAVGVWKAFAAAGDETERSAATRLQPYEGTVDALLADTAGGGTGRPFDWRLLRLYHKAAKAIGVPLFAAGGLHPDNVGELMRDYAPDGVDVSSGVETDGRKDLAKIRQFVERVTGR